MQNYKKNPNYASPLAQNLEFLQINLHISKKKRTFAAESCKDDKNNN